MVDLMKVDTTMAVARVLKGKIPSKGMKQEEIQPAPIKQRFLFLSVREREPVPVQAEVEQEQDDVEPQPERQQPKSAKLRDEPVVHDTKTPVKAPAEPSMKPPLKPTATPTPEPSQQDTNAEKSELDAPAKPDPAMDSGSGMRRTRPVSARPPPPKQKTPQVIQEKPTNHVTSIIVDGKKADDDDDDDEFVVKVIESTQKENMSSMATISSEQHGTVDLIIRWTSIKDSCNQTNYKG
jgi:hypothetical protein